MQDQKSQPQTPHADDDVMDVPRPNPGYGALTVFGAGMYVLEGAFIVPTLVKLGLERIYLRSFRAGDVVDASITDMKGDFATDMEKYAGTCRYSLKVADVDEGIAVLSIIHDDKKTKTSLRIARLEGSAGGLGEIYTDDKEGHLHIHPAIQNNIVKFVGDSKITTITFEPGDPVVTSGEKFHGFDIKYDPKNESNSISINCECERKGSKKCATYFSSYVGDKESMMMHTRGGNNIPKELHFAFPGTLTINGDVFDVCLGQGHRDSYYNWHFACAKLQSPNDHKSGLLFGDNGVYELKQHESDTFKVTKKK